ncbi:hypothetical protein [Catenulispora pinisilvae]|nr:hypothetical protein [Catenulispora pinisilvae]
MTVIMKLSRKPVSVALTAITLAVPTATAAHAGYVDPQTGRWTQ